MKRGQKSFLTRIENEKRKLMEQPPSAFRDAHVRMLDAAIRQYKRDTKRFEEAIKEAQ